MILSDVSCQAYTILSIYPFITRPWNIVKDVYTYFAQYDWWIDRNRKWLVIEVSADFENFLFLLQISKTSYEYI